MKIRDRERVEPPHVTILHKTNAWRYDLREPGFLDREPDLRQVPTDVLAEVHTELAELRAQWDVMYPQNPVYPAAERPVEDGDDE